jgi:hypothetical protein
MLKALANENAEDDRATAIRDTLLVTRKSLIEHPEECSIPAAKSAKQRSQRPEDRGHGELGGGE